METETTEVVETEIFPTDEKDTHVVGNIAIATLAAIGAVRVGKFVVKRVPFTIQRKKSEPETPVVPETTADSVATE